MNIFKKSYLWLQSKFVNRDTIARIDRCWYTSSYRVATVKKLSVNGLRNLSKTPLARSAINQIKDGIKSLPYEIYSIDNQKHKREIDTVKKILMNPNAEDDYDDFMDKVIEDLLVVDMGCFEKKKSIDNEKPLWLFPIDAETIEFVSGWDGDPKKHRYAQNHYSQKLFYTQDAIAVLQRSKFTYSNTGFSPMEQAYDHIQYLCNIHEYSDEVAGNAMPKYIVNLGEMTSQDELDSFRAYIENVVQGNSTLALVSTKNIDSKQVSPIGDDATCLSWQKMLIQIIATCFNIDPTRLGSAISNDRSTTSEKDNQMLEYTIKPWSKIIERAINKHIIDTLGLSTKVRFRFIYSPTNAQQDALVNRVVKMYNSDLITLKEARDELGVVFTSELSDIPESDNRFSEYKTALSIKVSEVATRQQPNGVDLDDDTEGDLEKKGEGDV